MLADTRLGRELQACFVGAQLLETVGEGGVQGVGYGCLCGTLEWGMPRIWRIWCSGGEDSSKDRDEDVRRGIRGLPIDDRPLDTIRDLRRVLGDGGC